MSKSNIRKPKISVNLELNKNFDYPLFCFKHLQLNISIKDCDNNDLFKSLIERLYKLSNLGWDQINKSDRHSYGWEKISLNSIKPQLPSIITPDIKFLYALRYTGNNLPFLGIRSGNIFHIIFIESKFDDIYKH